MSLPSATEVSERLVGSPAFKAGGTGDPRPAGSIPVHLRHLTHLVPVRVSAQCWIGRLCAGGMEHPGARRPR